MPRIHQLPHTVITKIAAGEVIERPASVVKELLENAIDAGARRIEIDLDQGGIDRIRVVDDGCGFEPEDLPLAFASHATSKLRDADDLFQIGSLGFRGEALASIGGVAQVALQSRPAELPIGAEIECQGGEVGPVRPWNGAAGTRLEVRHLFYNTPVRRKFLKSISTEVGHVCETFTRLALAHADLHLVLRHNQKLVYEVPGTASLFDRLNLFFGDDITRALYALDAEQGPVRLRGYIADPSCERGNARMQYLFVNGRWIRDRSLAHAIQEGYRGLLMTGRYPVSFLFLDLPADAVDVNVHPTKAEVRFRNAQPLYHLVLASVRERLRQANLTPRMQAPRQPIDPFAVAGDPGLATLPAPDTPSANPAAFADPPREPWSLQGSPPPVPRLSFSENRPDAPVLVEPPEAAPAFPTRLPQQFVAIQLHDAYIVVETPEGMLVIDQHALHERILFEHLRRRIAAGRLERQRLLIPEPVELSAESAARVLAEAPALEELGLGVEDFGGGTILLTSYPAILDRVPPVQILRGVIDNLLARERAPSREQLLNDLLASMACRAAVKAGDRLSAEEIASLLAQRDLAEMTHHCPHGRPTSLLFSRQDLDRQFRRI